MCVARHRIGKRINIVYLSEKWFTCLAVNDNTAQRTHSTQYIIYLIFTEFVPNSHEAALRENPFATFGSPHSILVGNWIQSTGPVLGYVYDKSIDNIDGSHIQLIVSHRK